jgi:hypothetical protein
MKTIYLTRYTDANRVPASPSQPMQMPSVQAAKALMFGGVPILNDFEHFVVLDLGGGQRAALSGYSFT